MNYGQVPVVWFTNLEPCWPKGTALLVRTSQLVPLGSWCAFALLAAPSSLCRKTLTLFDEGIALLRRVHISVRYAAYAAVTVLVVAEDVNRIKGGTEGIGSCLAIKEHWQAKHATRDKSVCKRLVQSVLMAMEGSHYTQLQLCLMACKSQICIGTFTRGTMIAYT